MDQLLARVFAVAIVGGLAYAWFNTMRDVQRTSGWACVVLAHAGAVWVFGFLYYIFGVRCGNNGKCTGSEAFALVAIWGVVNLAFMFAIAALLSRKRRSD